MPVAFFLLVQDMDLNKPKIIKFYTDMNHVIGCESIAWMTLFRRTREGKP